MRLSLAGICLALLTSAAAARASTIEVAFSGFTGDLGGRMSGTFTYDNAQTGGGYYASYSLTSLFINETGGINIGADVSVIPEVADGLAQPGQVFEVPSFSGSSLMGPLQFSYIIDGTPFFYSVLFNGEGYPAHGYIEFDSGSVSLYERFAADTVDYTVAPPIPTSITPEPSSLALLSIGLLGVHGVLKRRLLS